MNEENEKKNSVYISKGEGYALFKFLLAAKVPIKTDIY